MFVTSILVIDDLEHDICNDRNPPPPPCEPLIRGSGYRGRGLRSPVSHHPHTMMILLRSFASVAILCSILQARPRYQSKFVTNKFLPDVMDKVCNMTIYLLMRMLLDELLFRFLLMMNRLLPLKPSTMVNMKNFQSH